MIESIIKENTAAVEKLTATLERLFANGTPQLTLVESKTDKAPEPDVGTEVEVTMADIRSVMATLDRATGVALLEKYHATKLPEVHQDNYARLLDDAKAAAQEAAA